MKEDGGGSTEQRCMNTIE